MHAHAGIMANQDGRNGSTTEDKEGWRRHGEPPKRRRDDEERYRMRDDDERFERGSGSHWEDRERGYGERDVDRRGMGQSGYGAGRSGDDRSLGVQTRNTAWGGTRESGESDPYGRGSWEEGRIGMSQGYGYQDGDRPSFVRGVRDQRFGGGDRPRMLQRGPHRGKGPKGFEPSDARIHERVCEALADDHNIDASNIEVSVHEGEVTLTGSIDDRETKRMAEDCVLQCSGVRDVHNQLRIAR